MSEKARNIPLHEHCKVCGISIPAGKGYCSNACRQKSIAAEKRMKRTQKIYICSFIIIMVIALLLMFLENEGVWGNKETSHRLWVG
jgi:predicted nucleic acid-binding Zn ribbon protein